jgi:hypothetical protein
LASAALEVETHVVFDLRLQRAETTVRLEGPLSNLSAYVEGPLPSVPLAREAEGYLDKVSEHAANFPGRFPVHVQVFWRGRCVATADGKRHIGLANRLSGLSLARIHPWQLLMAKLGFSRRVS